LVFEDDKDDGDDRDDEDDEDDDNDDPDFVDEIGLFNGDLLFRWLEQPAVDVVVLVT
jgi:hypothetical protein